MAAADFDQSVKDRLAFLDANYDTPVVFHLNGKEKIYLGDRTSRVCRFCGKGKPDVTFNQIAHGIPEFVGNKKLFSLFECDACNAKFSRTLESHMANYMNLFHTISQVKGKNNVPSFKSNKQKSRIDVKNVVTIELHEDDELVTIDEENKIVTFKAKRASYVPIAIHKCLTKMALTVMPESELTHFKGTMAWINEEDHLTSPVTVKFLPLLMSIASGQHPYSFVTCGLFKRKATPANDVPYAIFLLAYANYFFQIYLPFCSEDALLEGREAKMVHIPTPVDMNEGSTKLRRLNIDLSSNILVKGEEVSIPMSFERFEDKQPEGI